MRLGKDDYENHDINGFFVKKYYSKTCADVICLTCNELKEKYNFRYIAEGKMTKCKECSLKEKEINKLEEWNKSYSNKIYNNIKILSVKCMDKNNHLRGTVQCLLCNDIYETDIKQVYTGKTKSCKSCSIKENAKQTIQKTKDKYEGKTIGYWYIEKVHDSTRADCRCLKCNTLYENFTLSNVLYYKGDDESKCCKNCSRLDYVESKVGEEYGEWIITGFRSVGNADVKCRRCNTDFNNIDISNILSGSSTMCSDCSAEEIRLVKAENIEGNQYGYWKVIKFISKHQSICKCLLCGETYTIALKNILNDTSTKCLNCSRKYRVTVKPNGVICKTVSEDNKVFVEFEDGTKAKDTKKVGTSYKGSYPTFKFGHGLLYGFDVEQLAYKLNNREPKDNCLYYCSCTHCNYHDILTPHKMFLHLKGNHSEHIIKEVDWNKLVDSEINEEESTNE